MVTKSEMNVKIFKFETICKSDTSYTTQLKRQKSKRCCHFSSTSP